MQNHLWIKFLLSSSKNRSTQFEPPFDPWVHCKQLFPKSPLLNKNTSPNKSPKFQKFRDGKEHCRNLRSCRKLERKRNRLLTLLKNCEKDDSKSPCISKQTVPPIDMNATLEEGEIREEVEIDNAKLTENVDDDCVYIEPEVEKIVINDDTPSCSRMTSGYVSIMNQIRDKTFSKILTSTPLVSTNIARASGEVLAFFEDRKGKPSHKAINSDNTSPHRKKQKNFSKVPEKGRKQNNSNENKANKSSEIIILDDTILQPKDENATADDSVIFVGMTAAPNAMPEFIPLQSDLVPNPIVIPSEVRKPRCYKKNDQLFTASEKKQLAAYNFNTYNPNGTARKDSSKKRNIIIDGPNVAFGHGLCKEFSVKGLKICIDYFEKMGHEVKAVVPQFRLHKCTDPSEMERLYKANKIVPTPCKNLKGLSAVSYDDRFVLQLAAELDAVIISNDNYRDLSHENVALKKLIENRVLGFTWCNDIFMVALDPYGAKGPYLQSILNGA